MRIYQVFVSGLQPSRFQWYFNSRTLKRGFHIPTIMGLQSNISLPSCLYWYATLNSCKYLKTKTHLQNAQINKVVNKGIVKTFLIWWSNVVAGCGFHYFVSARFGSFWVVNLCFTSTVGYGILLQAPLFRSSLYDAYMKLCNYQFYLVILHALLFHSALSFSFKLKGNTNWILCW